MKPGSHETPNASLTIQLLAHLHETNIHVLGKCTRTSNYLIFMLQLIKTYLQIIQHSRHSPIVPYFATSPPPPPLSFVSSEL